MWKRQQRTTVKSPLTECDKRQSKQWGKSVTVVGVTAFHDDFLVEDSEGSVDSEMVIEEKKPFTRNWVDIVIHCGQIVLACEAVSEATARSAVGTLMPMTALRAFAVVEDTQPGDGNHECSTAKPICRLRSHLPCCALFQILRARCFKWFSKIRSTTCCVTHADKGQQHDHKRHARVVPWELPSLSSLLVMGSFPTFYHPQGRGITILCLTHASAPNARCSDMVTDAPELLRMTKF
jgi:hypothetical protein